MFNQLRNLTTKAATLKGIGALLSWDQETGMPAGAIDARADQTALISELEHEVWISDHFQSTLSQLIDLKSGELKDNTLSEPEQTAVRLIYKDWKHAKALPSDFVSRYADATSRCQHAWADARAANDFKQFAPHLAAIVDLTKEKASYFPGFTCVYDALLDEFEPDMTVAELSPLFADLRDQTLALLHEINDRRPHATFATLKGHFDLESQRQFSLELLRDIGFDFTRGRFDPSVHPFTTDLHPTDIRITTRYDQHDLMENISSTLHEAGHGMYEQGLNADWVGTPLCESLSLGIHESQSRFWENVVGRSHPFIEAYLPSIQQRFPTPFAAVDATAVYRAFNQVHPSLIRVQADELTYNLHILIRYEVEQLLFNGSATIAELPEIWNQKYEDYLGIRPSSDATGILQDVHWSAGLFGYFPTYTLGNLFCAQYSEVLKADLPNFDALVRSRDFAPILGWLRGHIHQVGRGLTAPELIQKTTGMPLSADAFIRYARQKFLDIYTV